MKKVRVTDRYYAAMGAAMALLASNANAQKLSEMGANLSGEASALVEPVKILFGFFGFALVGFGIWGLATRKDNPQKPVSHSIWFIVGGAFLLLITPVLSMVTESSGFGETSFDSL